MKNFRDKTPTKAPQLNRSITEKIIKQIKYYGLPQQDYEIIDTDQGRFIEETRRKKITCEVCLVRDRRMMPHDSQLCENHQTRRHLTPDQHMKPKSRTPKQRVLSLTRLQAYYYHPTPKDDTLRRDNIDLLDTIMKMMLQKDGVMPTIKRLMRLTTTTLRKLTDPEEFELSLCAPIVALLSDNYFEEDLIESYVDDKKMTILKSQEHVIALQRVQVERSARLLIRPHADDTLMKQMMMNEVERLDTIVSQLEQQIDSQSNYLNTQNNIYDQLMKAMKAYKIIFPASSESPTINSRLFVQDLEGLSQLLGDHCDFTTLKRDLSNMQKINDVCTLSEMQELSRANLTIEQLHRELISQLQPAEPIRDPIVNKLIQELSLIILSKDASKLLSEESRRLITQIFNQNMSDVVQTYEQQLQALRESLRDTHTFTRAPTPPPPQESDHMMLVVQACCIEKLLEQKKLS